MKSKWKYYLEEIIFSNDEISEEKVTIEMILGDDQRGYVCGCRILHMLL